MFEFHRNSYAKTFETEVLSCREEGGRWEVTLADTIAYAEAGGQPSDSAHIGGVEVLESSKSAQTIRHYLPSPVEGTVRVEIDWERRFDFMQQHSAQHLITALAQDEFGWATTSFHLGEEYSAIEFDTDEVSARELDRLQARVNTAIRDSLPIRSRWVSASEYETLDVRSRGLPDGHTGDIRIVEIDGVDRNTCGGTHVRNTAELQAIHFSKLEYARGGARLHFLAGGRVLSAVREAGELHLKLSELLSVGPSDFIERIEKMEQDRKDASKSADIAWDAWADAQAKSLLESEERLLLLDLEAPRADLLARVASAADPEHERVFFGTAGDDECLFLLAGPEGLVSKLGPKVADALDGRGGGRGSRFQGKGSRAGRSKALALLEDAALGSDKS